MAQIELIPFIPKTANYQIWHPKDFLVNEDEKGIVTITSIATDSNLTLSSYYANQLVTETILLKYFHDATENYSATSEVKSVLRENKIWLEGDFQRENIYWIWWILSYSNQIILATVNSENVISSEDRHLFTFMLDKMEIYPAEVEE